MGNNRKRKRRKLAPAKIVFTVDYVPSKKATVPCVYAKCLVSDLLVGPFAGHTKGAMSRATASLTRKCDCPYKAHSCRETVGEIILENKTTRR